MYYKKAPISIALLILATTFIYTFRVAYAGFLPNRSVEVILSTPSAVTSHLFKFNYTNTNTVGSIQFEYCINDPFIDTPCTKPDGFDAIGAILSNQTGGIGFVKHPNTTDNRIVLSRAAIPTVPGSASYNFDNVINPSTPDISVYVRIATFASTDGTGTVLDSGGVVFSTSGDIGVTAYVPPYITFCVGSAIVGNCSNVTGSNVDIGILKTSEANIAESKMMAYTNDDTGYNIAVMGTTMTSGNNFIPALTTPTASKPGKNQFGINLRSNNNPVVGSDTQGAGVGAPLTDYGQVNLFKYNEGDVVASSSIPTEPNLFTVSYLVNIGKEQAPGVYVTTLSYIATASF